MFFVCCLLAGLGACGTAPTIQHYQFQIGENYGDSSTDCDETLQLFVEPLTIDSAYDDRRLVYRSGDYRLDYYHYHRWAAQPAELATDFVRRAFADRSCYSVASSGRRFNSEVLLFGRITALEELDRTPEDWFAHLSVVFEARSRKTGEVFWEETFEVEKRLEKQKPVAVVEALSRLLEGVVSRTDTNLRAAWKSYARQKNQSSGGSSTGDVASKRNTPT